MPYPVNVKAADKVNQNAHEQMHTCIELKTAHSNLLIPVTTTVLMIFVMVTNTLSKLLS